MRGVLRILKLFHFPEYHIISYKMKPLAYWKCKK